MKACVLSLLVILFIVPSAHAQGLYRRLASPPVQTATAAQDADGDGIVDALDRCPGTLANVPVDSHGCPLDRDRDGVPDYLDKQPMTPTNCQPVDADGVGKCPCNCPASDAAPCSHISPSTLLFDGESLKLTAAHRIQLATLASQMGIDGICKVVVIGSTRNNSQAIIQRSYKRAEQVIKYMVKQYHIPRERFLINNDATIDPNTIVCRPVYFDNRDNRGDITPYKLRPK